MAAKHLKPRQVRVPDSVWNWLKAQAREQERSVNWVVNRVLEQAQKREAQHG